MSSCASASLIRRHSGPRQLATLVATVRHLEARSIDDALELLDLLMTTELLGRALLEQFWRNLKRRDIWADASTQWRNPQARLLEGEAWAAARADVLTSLGLPGSPDALLAGHSRTLTPPTGKPAAGWPPGPRSPSTATGRST